MEGLVHGPARDDAGRLEFDTPRLLGGDVALAVHRVAERVDDAAHQRLAHGNLDDAIRAPDQVAFADVGGLTHDRDADVVLLEVEDHAVDAARKLHQLAGHRALESVHARDAVSDGQDRPCLGDVDLAVVLLDLALEDVGDFTRLDIHRSLSSRKSVAQLGELRAKASVENQPADHGHRASDEVGVDRHLEVDLLARTR